MEVNELFSGWIDHPPTNILVKAIVEGFGGGKKATIDETLDPSPAASYAMQQSVVGQIASKAGQGLPIVHGRDHGLPKAPPIFDIDELRKRNAEIVARRGQKNV